MTSQKAAYVRHFYALDVLRGLASLSIVFWHWQHFFFVGEKPVNFEVDRQPFFTIFRPFYLDGQRAVELFFCLSGFIFFWLYCDRIASGKSLWKEFAILRFSRLYPLHFCTLLLVALGQWIMFERFGSYFAYPNNDVYHFILQFFFASSWGLEKGPSFNGPVWSVSIEVLLYAIFFGVCSLRWNRWWHLVLYAFVGSMVADHFNHGLMEGLFSFFIGGLAYQCFFYCWKRGLSRSLVASLLFVTGLLWIAIPLNLEHDALYQAYRGSFLQRDLMIHHKDVMGFLVIKLTQNSCEMILFPTTLLALAVTEAFRGTLGKRLALLGNISYSTYLLHFPLQLGCIIGARSLSLPTTFFYSPWVMLGFFGVLIPISVCSYYFLERPCQKILRQTLLAEKVDPKCKIVSTVPTP